MAQRLLPAPVTFDTDAVQTNAKLLVELIAEGMGEADEAVFDYDYKGRVEEIESEPRDGFWPWTSGGYMVTLPAALSHHWGTGNAPAPIQPMIDAGDQFLADEWARRHPDRPPLIDCITSTGEHTGIPAEWQAEAEEWESEGWAADDDTYFWKARAIFYRPGDFSADDDMVEPYVHLDAYLNTDLNYGRDSIRWLIAYGQNPDQTTGDFQRRIPLRVFAALTEPDLQAIADEAVRSLP